MEFEITHTTHYKYGQPAAEAYVEARLTPPPSRRKPSSAIASSFIRKRRHRITWITTATPSISFRCPSATRSSSSPTTPSWPRNRPGIPKESLELCVQEARQIFNSALTDVFDFLQPTEIVEIGSDAVQWAKKYLPGHATLGEGLQRLNEAIHDELRLHQRRDRQLDAALRDLEKPQGRLPGFRACRA